MKKGILFLLVGIFVISVLILISGTVSASQIDWLKAQQNFITGLVDSYENDGTNYAYTYDPALPQFSDLHNIDYLHGYWVKMNESANLMVIGTAPENKKIKLEKNWNLISYMCNENKNVSDVFSSIMDKVIVINGFENGALTYDPKLPMFSDLKEMKPNYGYC